MAIVHHLRGHATGAIFQFGDRSDQLIHARYQRQGGPLGGFGLVGGRLGAAGDEFGGCFHIAAGSRAIAVEQFGLILHRLSRIFQLAADPTKPQFQQVGLRPQGAGGVEIAARFGTAVADHQQIGDGQQNEGNGYGDDGIGPGEGPCGQIAGRGDGPTGKADPASCHHQQGPAEPLDRGFVGTFWRFALVYVENGLFQKQNIVHLRLVAGRGLFVSPELDDGAAPCHVLILASFPAAEMPCYQNLTQAR